MSTYVVIGSNSFSGSDFIDHLLNQSSTDRVIGVSRSPEKHSIFLPYKFNLNQHKFTFRQYDVNWNHAELLDMLDKVKPEYIANFASQSEVAPSWDHPEQWYETNVVALARIINHLKGVDYLRKFLHISTPEVYGTCEGVVTEESPFLPSTPYAASRAAAEEFLQLMFVSYGFPISIVRSTNVYGAHQQLWKVIPRAIIYTKLGRKLHLHGGGHAIRSFIHISDVSRAELSVLHSANPGEVYNISPNSGWPIRDTLELVYESIGVKMSEWTEVTGERLGHDATYKISSRKLREEFDWEPSIPITEGIRHTIHWIGKYWDVIQNMPLEYQHRE